MTIKHTTSARLVERIVALEATVAARAQEQAVLVARNAELEARQTQQHAMQATIPDARLNTLLTICAALLVTHERTDAIDLVVRQGSQLFPGAIGAALFLADQDAQRLVLHVSSTRPANGLTLLPGQGLAGRAFLAPRAMLLGGAAIVAALGELDAEQTTQIKGMLEAWPPASALLAPLRLERERLGALVIYGGAHVFQPYDIPFIQGLADLAAVAIVEHRQRERAAASERDLTQTRSRQAEAESRLDVAQAQLLQSAKLAAVGELAASVAHEINNPLYAARNSLYLIEQELSADSPHRPFLDIAQQELGRIARIITRMHDFYRPDRAELIPTDVNAVLIETLDLVQTHLRHSQITVETDLIAGLPQIVAHADQLRQVFLNLMLNACDAMPHGGRLRVTTDLRQPTDGQPPQLLICIADTGIGIPPEHLPRLFEPFYTTKPQGTGLGLAISMHIVTQHGGTITLISNPGVGTAFTVTLPIK